MNELNFISILKTIQAVINSEPGLNEDDSIVDNRLSIIKHIVDETEDKNDFFYYLLIKVIGMNLRKIYNRDFRKYIGLVLDENCKLIPQKYGKIFTKNDTTNLREAELDFLKSLFEYICDILENNKDIMLDVTTLINLLDRDPGAIEEYYYRPFNFSRIAKIIKENQTLEKSNVSLEDTYQIMYQTYQYDNEDVFGNLIPPEQLKKS